MFCRTTSCKIDGSPHTASDVSFTWSRMCTVYSPPDLRESSLIIARKVRIAFHSYPTQDRGRQQFVGESSWLIWAPLLLGCCWIQSGDYLHQSTDLGRQSS